MTYYTRTSTSFMIPPGSASLGDSSENISPSGGSEEAGDCWGPTLEEVDVDDGVGVALAPVDPVLRSDAMMLLLTLTAPPAFAPSSCGPGAAVVDREDVCFAFSFIISRVVFSAVALLGVSFSLKCLWRLSPCLATTEEVELLRRSLDAAVTVGLIMCGDSLL